MGWNFHAVYSQESTFTGIFSWKRFGFQTKYLADNCIEFIKKVFSRFKLFPARICFDSIKTWSLKR